MYPWVPPVRFLNTQLVAASLRVILYARCVTDAACDAIVQ